MDAPLFGQSVGRAPATGDVSDRGTGIRLFVRSQLRVSKYCCIRFRSDSLGNILGGAESRKRKGGARDPVYEPIVAERIERTDDG